MMFYRVLVSILHIKIARKSCQNRKIEYGMRRISITTADIEILKGYFFSDDGLIFVTYDHYQTFFQIV